MSFGRVFTIFSRSCLFVFSVNQNMVLLNMKNVPSEEICQWADLLRTQSGIGIKKLLKYWHSDSPSIQGIWTPFTNKDTRLNIAQFPSAEFGAVRRHEETATEKLMKMVQSADGVRNIVIEQDVDEGTPV